MDFNFYLTVIIDGAVFGSIYGLFGVCLVLIYRANRLFNFCLTQLAAFIILIVTSILSAGYSPVPVIVGSVVASFGIGWLLHFSVMRFVTERKSTSHLNETLLTIGLLMVFDGVASFIYGEDARGFPSIFGVNAIEILELNISHQSIGVIAVSLVALCAIYAFFKFSDRGLEMEAVAENLVAARLRGIRASNVLAIAWGLTTALSVLAGVMVAPAVFVYPAMFATVFSYASMAVVIGGLESPLGAILGGWAIGMVEHISAQFEPIGPDLKFGIVFVFLIVVLIIRPYGIWGKDEGRKV